MKKTIMLLLILATMMLVACQNTLPITSFEECIAAGNPAMESYPRQCRDSISDQTFTEVIPEPTVFDFKTYCEDNNGKWLSDFVECEDITREACESADGVFDECGSACRNDPEAEMCTLQCVQVCDFKQEEKTFCTDKQRGVQACTMEFNPVCGWSDETIQCIKYPCASTYSNPCVACSERTVEYWTAGECPA
ncbi:hypothetical protein GOV05_03740 [Candidatus Woesearchaeota archaeon]|nr:hypothetical protein [Candidatus Woesearchaeota archaeon]